MTDNTKMREEFEKWHMERYGGFGLGRSTEPGYTDEYERAGTNLQWVAWQAARKVPEASSAIFASRCPMCFYQHGHQIGCENNPIDIALRAAAPEGKK